MAFESEDRYANLKAVIASRSIDRTKQCREFEGMEKILRAQGASRELAELESIIFDMENPPKEENPQKMGEDLQKP